MDKVTGGRAALKVAERELDDCHFQIRQDRDEIENLHKQVLVLRTEKENQAYKMWVDMLTWKVLALYAGLVAFAALIW